MKIAFVVESFASKDELSGGVRVSVRRQAESLSQEHDLFVIAARTIFPGLARYSAMREAQGSGTGFRSMEGRMRIYRPPCLHVPLLWKILGPLQLVLWIAVVCSVLERRNSLLHSHRCFPAGFASCLAGRLLRVPVVLTTYGSDVNVGLRRESAGFWVSIATRFTLTHASIVIAVSKALAAKIESVGVEAKRIRIIPSGVDSSLARTPGKIEARKRLGLPIDGRIVLMASNLVQIKDPLTMVRAFVILRRTLKDAILVILGKGELEGAVRSEIDRRSAADFILPQGRRPREEIPFWLSASDVVALSSLEEGCPVIALEGFVSGKPFVGTAVGGVPEIVTDESEGILVQPGDPAELARALERALGKKWDTEKIVSHGLEYSWENVSKRISLVYSETRGDSGVVPDWRQDGF